ncbi:hypothetical protein [Kitasatospora cheerisanensis]|nr:hypothetical protein [Kitasatospora cheerisanensis]
MVLHVPGERGLRPRVLADRFGAGHDDALRNRSFIDTFITRPARGS